MSEDLKKQIAELKAQNEALQKKSNKWIETDKTLLGRKRKAKIVTYLDLQKKSFKEQYPNAKIGDEIPDSKPLLYQVGFKKQPTLQQKSAEIAARIGRELREEMEIGQDETDLLLDDNDDPDHPSIAYAEAQAALYDSLPYAEEGETVDGTPTQPKPVEESSAPQNAGADSSTDEAKAE